MNKRIIAAVLLCSMLFISCENALLGPDRENTPANNFDLLWHEFDMYYPAFNVKNINWDSLYNIYRYRIKLQTGDDELWNITCRLLWHLDDIHVYIYNNDLSKFFSSAHRDNYEMIFNPDLVKFKYLLNKYNTSGNGNFVYGRLCNNTVGYIYIKSFTDDLVQVSDIDNIISQLSDVEAMIIDLRDNRGGINVNYKYVASAFIDKDVTFIIEKARNGPGHNDFTEPYYHTLKPREGITPYTKKIVLLTNSYTASASEHFVLILKKFEYTKQIGDTTAGGLGFSHRSFQLLNGWAYHMPTSICLTTEGESLENIGIKPDIYIRNYDHEIIAGYDRQLEYTIWYLSQ